MKKLIIAMLLFVSISANGEIFRCLDADGKTIYQSSPCPNDRGDFIDLNSNTKMSVEEYNKKKEQERIKQEQELAQKLEAAKLREAQKTETSSTYTPSSIPYYSGSKSVNVRGYTRKDGTYVRPHSRSRGR